RERTRARGVSLVDLAPEMAYADWRNEVFNLTSGVEYTYFGWRLADGARRAAVLRRSVLSPLPGAEGGAHGLARAGPTYRPGGGAGWPAASRGRRRCPRRPRHHVLSHGLADGSPGARRPPRRLSPGPRPSRPRPQRRSARPLRDDDPCDRPARHARRRRSGTGCARRALDGGVCRGAT